MDMCIEAPTSFNEENGSVPSDLNALTDMVESVFRAYVLQRQSRDVPMIVQHIIDGQDDKGTDNLDYGEFVEILFSLFPHHGKADPERVVRRQGDTTIFTTAGVQRIESLLKRGGDLNDQAFSISQPVIRSQFIEEAKCGTGSSFLNFAAVEIGANFSSFLRDFKSLLETVSAFGAEGSDIALNFDESQDSWGLRSFRKFTISVSVKDVEIGEAILLPDFPLDETRKTCVVDIGIGLERLLWSVSNRKSFFPNCQEFYLKRNADAVTSVLDCIRTSVLIAGEGIRPGNKNAGYRIRKLMKCFVERNQDLGIDWKNVFEGIWNYWIQCGFEPLVEKREVFEILEKEIDRASNAKTLRDVEIASGRSYYIEINQSRSAFLSQARISLPRELHGIIT